VSSVRTQPTSRDEWYRAVQIKRIPMLGTGVAYIGGGPPTRLGELEDLDRLAVCPSALQNEYVRNRKLALRISAPLTRPELREPVARVYAACGFVPARSALVYRRRASLRLGSCDYRGHRRARAQGGNDGSGPHCPRAFRVCAGPGPRSAGGSRGTRLQAMARSQATSLALSAEIAGSWTKSPNRWIGSADSRDCECVL
jgi:hypothetical protein